MPLKPIANTRRTGSTSSGARRTSRRRAQHDGVALSSFLPHLNFYFSHHFDIHTRTKKARTRITWPHNGGKKERANLSQNVGAPDASVLCHSIFHPSSFYRLSSKKTNSQKILSWGGKKTNYLLVSPRRPFPPEMRRDCIIYWDQSILGFSFSPHTHTYTHIPIRTAAGPEGGRVCLPKTRTPVWVDLLRMWMAW